MSKEEFLRLSSLIERYGQAEVSDGDVTNATSILLSAYTRRELRPEDWRPQEEGTPYWQLLRARRPPWRASAEARAAWTRALRERSRPPIIDSDLLDFAMLASWQATTNAAGALWRERSLLISDLLADLDQRRRAAAAPLDGFDAIVVETVFQPQVIASVTAQTLIAGLSALYANMESDRDATRRIEQLGMTRGAFMALMRSRAVLEGGGTLLDSDWEVVYAILLQVMKQRMYARWRDEERAAGISLSPDFFVLPQEIRGPGDLPDWRASYTDMLDWQDRLQSRIDQQEAVRTALQTLILQVEARHLPVLRDQLIAMLPIPGQNFREKVDWVTDNLFIDAAESGQRRTTRVQQAIESLQVLLLSARTGQLDEYPDLRLAYSELPSGYQQSTFDSDWTWIGSYATWRSALFVFLYPENLLRPSLRQRRTPAFRDLVTSLRAESRLTPSRAQTYADAYAEYFRDVCTLQLDFPDFLDPVNQPRRTVGVTADTFVFPGSDSLPVGTTRRLAFIFGLSPASGRVYWSSIDPSEDRALFAQSFWQRLTGFTSPITDLIGAAFQSGSPGFIYVFGWSGQVGQSRDEESLVYLKRNLTTGEWDSEASPLTLDNLGLSGAIVDRIAWLRAKDDPQPPELRLQLRLVRVVDPVTEQESSTGTLIFYGRLNQTGTGWDRAGLRRIYNEGQWIERAPIRLYDGNGYLPGIRAILSGDFDNDQRDELIVFDTGRHDRFWLIDFDGLTFAREEAIAFSAEEALPAGLAATGDFDGDLSPELLVAMRRRDENGNLQEFFYQFFKFVGGARRWAPWGRIVGFTKLLAIGRFTNPNRDQVVLGFSSVSPFWVVWERTPNAWQQASVFSNFLPAEGLVPASFAVAGDFDGDGLDEIAIARSGGGTDGNDFFVVDYRDGQWQKLGRTEGDPATAWHRWEIDYSGEPPPAAFGVAGKFRERNPGTTTRKEMFVGPFKDSSDNDPFFWFSSFNSDVWTNQTLLRTQDGGLRRPAVHAIAFDFDRDGRDELAVVTYGDSFVRIFDFVFDFADGPGRWVQTAVDFERPVAFAVAANFDGRGTGLACVPGSTETVAGMGLEDGTSFWGYIGRGANGENEGILIREWVGGTTTLSQIREPNVKPTFLGPFAVSRGGDPSERRRRTEETLNANSGMSLSVQTYLEEAFYFVPMQIGIALQQAGHYVAALDWFRTVYDYSQPPDERKIYYGLKREEQGAINYDRAADWLRDPLAPHRIAANRPFSYSRFTVQQIIRCMLDYADAEFTRDTVESLPIARTLYITALELLASPDLAQPSDPCNQQIDRIPIDLGGPALRQALLRLRAALGRLGHRPTLQDTVERVLAALQASNPPTLAERISVAAEIVGDAADPSPRPIAALVAQPLPVATALLPQDLPLADALGAVFVVADAPASFVPSQVHNFCVPRNQIPRSLRLHAELNLFKLRDGRNIAGVRRELDLYVAPTDTVTGLPAIGSEGQLILPLAANPRPTPYRYAALIERARQLVQIAQQMEGALLAALEKRDAEAYQVLKARQDSRLARAGVRLQELRVQEAQSGVALAELQRQRAEIQTDTYQDWLNEGENDYELEALQALQAAAGLQEYAAQAQYLAAGISLQAVAAAADPRANASTALSAAASAASSVGGMLSSLASAASTRASIASARATHARRVQEWTLALDLARQDVAIGNQQIRIAEDHVRVTEHERTIANIQVESADDTIEFLNGKFTSVELYDWMIGVLQGGYRYFLQQATGMAQLASEQLAFERAEPAEPVIQSDYWETASAEDALSSGEGRGPDRRGLTGSTRLLQDITRLDQQAFESNRRRLQLVKTVSLSQLAPVEFYRFRESGLITFNVPLEQFDRDFPGHYHRLIRRVRTSVVALVPPTQGIRASLTSTGTSRVVVGDTLFQAIRLRRDPESVALTSPINATGLFELEAPAPELNLPFEWCGADMAFELRMPRAANPFDYQTIADVLFTIEYTAFDSYDYRQQVLQTMRPTLSSERPFSFRQEFSDAWYDLHNPEQSPTPMAVRFDIGRSDFAANVDGITIQNIAFYVASSTGSNFELRNVGLYLTPSQGGGRFGGNGETREGLISTRQGNAGSWALLQGQSPVGQWELQLPGSEEQFRSGAIEDILFLITYGGRTPPWPQ